MASSSGQAPEQALFYAPLEGRLCQGDIIRGVPWGLIPAPVEICRKQGRQHQATTHLLEALPSAFKKGHESILAVAAIGLVMVVWPDCQIDKFQNQNRPEDRWFAGVAPVLPLTPTLPPDVQQQVRDGLRRMYSWVPPNEPLGIPESYVDLRHIWSVKQSLLTERAAGLSVDARAALVERLYAFLTYMRPKASVQCPHCGGSFPSSQLFESDSTDL